MITPACSTCLRRTATKLHYLGRAVSAAIFQSVGVLRRVGLWTCAAVALMGAAISSCGSPSSQAIAAVVSRAKQAADDSSYFPVQVGGRWALSGPKGTWLQPIISTNSSPWRWTAGRCTVIEDSLVPGMRTFMRGQFHDLFTPELAAKLEAQFLRRVQVSTAPNCVKVDPTLVVGPPGPILDQTKVENVVVSGTSASVTAQVKQTDWQGGVLHRAAPGTGRFVGWAVVPGLLDATFQLRQDASGKWRVSTFEAAFAPGHEP
jgi:hypothetical protein